TIANVLGSNAHFERSYNTINKYYATLATITPADIQKTAQKYVTDANLVVTTLSKDPLPEGIAKAPGLATFGAPKAAGTTALHLITQKSVLPNVMVKLLFTRGSARKSCRM